MAKPKVRVPSLQHVARSLRDSPEAITKALVRTALSPPKFSCTPLSQVARDFVVFGRSAEQMSESIRRAERRSHYQKILLEVVPILHAHLSRIPRGCFQDAGREEYSLARDIIIPFQPPMYYRAAGEWVLPWFSWWRSNPLCGLGERLFVTMVDEMLRRTGDHEAARLEILDFSIPAREKSRELKIRDASTIVRLSIAERNELLEIWAEGFRRARAIVAAMPDEPRGKKHAEPAEAEPTFIHPDLFDTSGEDA